MRRGLALVALGILTLSLQGVASQHLEPGSVPDLVLCLVVALALQLPSAGALAAAATLGYGADLLSGALLGQHALLRALSCALTRLANRRLDLHRAIPLAFFVAAFTMLDAALLSGLTRVFSGRIELGPQLLLVLAPQALLNAVAAPVVLLVTQRVLAWTATDEGPRRSVRLEPRRPLL